MTHPLGTSRTVVRARYALFAPDGLVPSVVPGWENCVTHIHISEKLGADFSQSGVTMAENGSGKGSTGDLEMFVFVLEGECVTNGKPLSSGGFVFLPPETDYEIRAAAGDTRLLLFQKKYAATVGAATPPIQFGREQEIAGQPFLGDPRARLQVLLPDNTAFDMAVNIFTYDPGAALPFVETHVMEHGLLMLSGAGVYRLDADWFPVQAGDVIWMAPFCPQWFVALGPEPARYLYYKDVNRAPL